jgi:hypothetical protein
LRRLFWFLKDFGQAGNKLQDRCSFFLSLGQRLNFLVILFDPLIALSEVQKLFLSQRFGG